MKRITSLLLLSLALTGCGHYLIHPGAENKFESVTYDTISGAKILIDVSREQFANGTLPASFKPLMSGVISSYNKAAVALMAYDDAIKQGAFADKQLAELNAAVTALDTAIIQFKGAKK